MREFELAWIDRGLKELRVVENWLLSKISDVFNYYQLDELDIYESQSQQTTNKEQSDRNVSSAKNERNGSYLAGTKARGEWFAAIAALEKLLLYLTNSPQSDKDRYLGLILSAPAAILSHPALMSRFQRGIFTPETFNPLALPPQTDRDREVTISPIAQLSLLPNDPIAEEQFCLALTHSFGLVMVLGEDNKGNLAFRFSFEPEIILQAWQILRSRLSVTKEHQLSRLDALVRQYHPPVPDYRTVTHFSRQLLEHLPSPSGYSAPKLEFKQNEGPQIPDRNDKLLQLSNQRIKRQQANANARRTSDFGLPLPETLVGGKLPEIELLQALTHEIRTPLTTIRTLTRLLLKRRDLPTEAIARLESIDQECTEQINRMELIFRAVEIETAPLKHDRVQLICTPLEQVFQQSIPRWKRQAQRRNVRLEVLMPQKLPRVISDPGMLEKVLTGLMENITRSMPCGGEIQVKVTTAGDRLKLQLLSQCSSHQNPLKSIGQLLMFQPETGSLSLSLEVTKNLFHTLGGKMIVRQRSRQIEELTIFLPLGSTQSMASL